MKRVKLSKYVNMVFVTPDNSGSWFGYYNYDPLNFNHTKLLCSRAEHDAELPRKGYNVEVGYYDIESGEWHKVGMSDSYSWPQACMSQWLPGNGNESKIIYNTSDGKKNIAIIHDLKSKVNTVVDWSIYGITPNGNKSIALVMERSHWCRAYHYESVSDKKYDGKVYEEDGVYEIDLKNNTRKKLISIQQIIAMDYEDYFKDAKHWLEHIMISPNGKRFCFLHRFTVGSLNDYETRLFIADIDGGNLQCVNGWKEYYWSHFGWNGDEAFVIYSYKSNIHNRILSNYKKTYSNNKAELSNCLSIKTFVKDICKMIFHVIPLSYRKRIRLVMGKQNSYYQYYKSSNRGFELVSCFKNPEFSVDGHPSFTNDGKYMITDTYPHPNKYQDLMIYNMETHKVVIVCSLYAALDKKPGSCDLHPKLCKNNDYVAIDSAHDGQHHLILLKINWDKVKQKIG